MLLICIAGGLSACGDDDASSGSATTGVPTASDPGGPPADAPADGDPTGDGELDHEAIDPCLLEPDEVQTLRLLNPEVLGDFGTIGVGTADTSSRALPTCNYEMISDEGEVDSAIFSVVLLSVERETECFVIHRGVCVAPGSTYTDGTEEIVYEVPSEIAEAVKERIDAQ